MTADTVNEQILKILEAKGTVSSLDLAHELQIPHATIVGNINSIKSLGDVIETDSKPVTKWELTEEGCGISEQGSYEVIVFDAVLKAGNMGLPDIMKLIPQAKIGLSKALANKWIKLEKPSNVATPLINNIVDEVKEDLLLLKANEVDKVPDTRKQDYKKRKLIREVVTVTYIVSKGKAFTTSTSKPETELTAELLANDLWKTVTFKPYNFEALGVPPSRGHLHPLMKVRTEFKEIFLEMGFKEMPTNKYVESSFWNFDALFQPQQHPARDAHDTFFLTHPKHCSDIPKLCMEKVAKVHSSGGYGSQGYHYDWSIEEAKKNLLRTHTTAVSATVLHKWAKTEPFEPVKFFSIDKVFRNETLDATHLAEFHQVEGVVADYGISLGDLIGVLYEFFKKLGIEKLKFKPAYNPYTEPSMEIFCYHPGLQKWIEVGNSGMFRPEMLLPLGLPPNVNVLGWGLSLERPTMVKYGINNIRDLIGPRVQLQMVSENAICRLDK